MLWKTLIWMSLRRIYAAKEIASLQQQVKNGPTKGKLKSTSDRKFDMNLLEKEASSIPKDIGEDDGEDDDTSDGLVDVDFLKSVC